MKIEDLLHASNPWRGKDCGRKDCLLCSTKMKTGKDSKQCCRKRNIMYEIWCRRCEEKMNKEVEEKGLELKEERRQKKNLKLSKYIEESARSVYERTKEHANALIASARSPSWSSTILTSMRTRIWTWTCSGEG